MRPPREWIGLNVAAVFSAEPLLSGGSKFLGRIPSHLFVQLSKFLAIGGQGLERRREILAMADGACPILIGGKARIGLIRIDHLRVLFGLGQIVLCFRLVILGDTSVFRWRFGCSDQGVELLLA